MKPTLTGILIGAVLALTWIEYGFWAFFFVAIAITVGGTDRAQESFGDGKFPFPDGQVDWLASAARVLARDPARRIRSLLTMNVNAMQSGDRAKHLETLPESLAAGESEA